MILFKFQIYDSKAAAWLPPFYEQNSAVTIRKLISRANVQGHPWQEYPADYTLFELGIWDDQTGDEELTDAKTNLGTILQLMAVNPKPLTFDRPTEEGAQP